jgi:hypothetical protein
LTITSPHIDTVVVTCTLLAAGLPLLASAVNFLLPGKTGKASGWLSLLAILGSLVSAGVVFSKVWNAGEWSIIYLH